MLIFMVRHIKTYPIHYQSDHLINTTRGYKKESHCAVGNVLEQTVLSERYETSERDREEKGSGWDTPRMRSGLSAVPRKIPCT